MITPYTPALAPIALGLGKLMQEEGAFKNRNWNPQRLLALLDSPTTYCAFYSLDDQYIGGILGMITPQYFGDDLMARDLAIYLRPEHRGGIAVVRLIKAFEQWARDRGAKEIYLSQSTGVEVAMVEKLYQRLGYEVVGCLTKKELP